MQEFGNVEQNNETSLQFADASDVTRFAFRKDTARGFDLGRRNLEDFRSRVDDEADQFVVEFDDENAVPFVGLNFGLTEAFAEVHDRNDLPAQIDDAFDQVRRAGDGSNLRNADNLAHGSDANAVRFIADAKADDLKIFFHREVSGPLGTRHFCVFEFLFAARLGVPAIGAVGFPATRALGAGAVQNKFVHPIEQVAGKLEHLLGGGGELGRTGSGLLHEFAHLVHGADDGLCAGSLLFDGGINFLGDFGEAAGGLGDLRRADGLFVGGGTDFLGELVNFGDDVGDFVESTAKLVAQSQTFLNDARAALHVLDGLACFAL